MSDQISLTIDGALVTVEAGTTILKAAQAAGIDIPTLCYHDYCTANALCRICVVEVEGSRTLVPACVSKANQGAVIHTRSDRVVRARRTILEMLSATVDLTDAPEVLSMLSEYQVDLRRFPDAKPRLPALKDDNPMYIRDYSKCILCWRCVQVCAEDAQYAYAINFSGRGYGTQVSTFFEKGMLETTCVFCGQCVGVCPTGALKPKRQYLTEQGENPDTIMSLTASSRRKGYRRQNLGGGS